MNTNDLVELGLYVESLAPETEWYEHAGILGLSPLASLFATLALFLIILYVLGVIYHKKEKGRWLIPDARYWLEIARGLGISMKTWAGLPTPRAFHISEDAYYHNPSALEALNAAEKVRAGMQADGWSLATYRRRTVDCEDFCYRFKADMAMALAPVTPANRGVAVGIVGYTRADGAGHVICFVETSDEGRLYFEGFPHSVGAMKPLVAREEASIAWQVV